MKIHNIIFTALILLVTFQLILGQEKVIDNNCQIPFELKFEKIGVLYLLVEPQYFEPQKLKSLFTCLSRNRAELFFLSITALSDEKQLDKAVQSFKTDLTRNHLGFPPDNHPRYPEGYKPEPPPPPDYYRAYYNRYKEEYFQYSQNPQKWELTTVVIKHNILIK